MTLETLRALCLALPEATEDVKWGADLAFCVGGKMFCVTCLNPPHMTSFKCTPEEFGELSERPGLRPAPYLARAMWIQEEELGATLSRQEFERLIRVSYELVRAKLPRPRFAASPSKTPSSARRSAVGRKRSAVGRKKKPGRTSMSAGRRSRAAPAGARRRKR